MGVGVIASGVEYIDEPALVLMLCDLPADSFQLFSGRQPLAGGDGSGGFQPHAALVHVDPSTHDLDELLVELAARDAAISVAGRAAEPRGSLKRQWLMLKVVALGR